VTAIADSIAQACSDYNTNFVTGTSSAATTMNSGVGGTGATTATLGRVLAYAAVPNLSAELLLLPKVNTVAANVAAYLTGVRTLTPFYQQFYPLLDALDTAQSGLNAFLATNTLQVNAFFAAAFNGYATNAVTLGYRTSANAPTAIAVAQYFPYASIDTMWGFTASGATTFSANAVGANTSTSGSGGGVGQFYIYKNNSSNAVGGATFTISYTKADGTTGTATYSTTSGVPLASGSLSAGYAISGAIGSAITAVTGSGMTSAEQYTIGMQLVRASAY
jgi:hypothetical protein